MMLIQEVRGVISFNVEALSSNMSPGYTLNPGDRVKLRTDMSEEHGKILTEIASHIGWGPFQIVKSGTRKNLVKNESGKEAWVPKAFLTPI